MSRRIRIAHSPDADDAFMFYGLSDGGVGRNGYLFEHVLSDIETLNREAARGTYELTAVSFCAYPGIADRYRLLPTGASVGEGYGPVLVARETRSLEDLRGKRVALPGRGTTAGLLATLATGGVDPVWTPFDRIPEVVAGGEVEAGVLIHEGQLTYADEGLALVADLGVWWTERTGLPCPLGGNAIRRDLPETVQRDVADALHRSIAFGLAHRDDGIDYAMRYARGLEREMADRFVGMYVNARTLDLGEDGRRAVERLLREGAEADWIPPVGEIDWLEHDVRGSHSVPTD